MNVGILFQIFMDVDDFFIQFDQEIQKLRLESGLKSI